MTSPDQLRAGKHLQTDAGATTSPPHLHVTYPVHRGETMNQYDVIIIGGGIGGLATAALLADSGVNVMLLEQHTRPGGCAASFNRGGYIFESGATVGCGFHDGGPMHWLGERLGVQWPVTELPVAWEFVDNDLHLPLSADRQNLLELFPKSENFWQEQEAVASRLWELTNALLGLYRKTRPSQLARLFPTLLSTFCSRQVLQLSTSTAGNWLKRHQLLTDERFRRFIDAQLLISAQTDSSRANGLFSTLALDLPRKKTYSIAGGVGSIADVLVDAVRVRGGTVLLGEKATNLLRSGNRITEVATTNNSFRCSQVVLNGSSAALANLLKPEMFTTESIAPRVRHRACGDWGAFVLHLGLRRNILAGRTSRYLQLLEPGGKTLGECGSLFLSSSIPADSGRGGAIKLAMTVSTHTAVAPWWQALENGRSSYQALKEKYSNKMLTILSYYLDDFRKDIDLILTGTPVTYARYTGRHLGLVGGYAQTGGLPPRQDRQGIKNLRMVGDNCFPGQSMAGVTVGAVLVADGLLRKL